MNRTHSDNPTRLSSTEHRILSLVDELGEAYGLQLFRYTKGEIKKGTVYVLLGRLSARGFVVSERVPLPEGEVGPSRVVYRVTEAGGRALKAWAAARAAWSV